MFTSLSTHTDDAHSMINRNNVVLPNVNLRYILVHIQCRLVEGKITYTPNICPLITFLSQHFVINMLCPPIEPTMSSDFFWGMTFFLAVREKPKPPSFCPLAATTISLSLQPPCVPLLSYTLSPLQGAVLLSNSRTAVLGGGSGGRAATLVVCMVLGLVAARCWGIGLSSFGMGTILVLSIRIIYRGVVFETCLICTRYIFCSFCCFFRQ